MKKILIIEDDELLGDLLVHKLKASGYDCLFVRDGAEGFAQISKWMPDLIILDLFLPLLNGFDILNQKKLDNKISGIPAMVLTNSLRPTNAGGFEKLNVSDFIIKSEVTQEEILARIKKVLDSTESANAAQFVAEHNILSGKTILIVEDDKFLGSILTARLSDRKASVVYSITGEAALDELKKKKPDVILLDILLPGINGFEVLKNVRDNPETKETPVIVISNFNQASDKEKAEAMGAQFLVKALSNPDEIVEHVEAVLKKAKV